MATHSDIISKAQQISPNLFDFKNKGEAFVYHMKTLNAILLLRLPNFSLGVPFFPNLDELTSRLSEAYLNDRRASNVDGALKQAREDRANIERAVKEVMG
jgi:hypothetical protein